MVEISAQDRERIASAIHAAEARTSGEIVCVLARSSADAPAWPIFTAALAALLLPWLLLAFTTMTVHSILFLQILFFLVLVGIVLLPSVRVALMPRRARRAVAHRVAREQFLARGLARKKDRSGVLIFVSLAEHYARIIADDGIAARVAQPQWQEAIDLLIAHMRNDRIADGFVAAIGACGDLLSTHFPRTEATRGELPDRIYLI